MNNKNQTKLFEISEGDAWFNRNRVDQTSKTVGNYEEFVIKKIRNFEGKIKNVLEIGCSDGLRLVKICKSFGANGSGIDPSKMAVAKAIEINDGDSTLEFSIGTSDNLPYPDEKFDLVYFGFCLYLVDRTLLLRTIAEADRVLKKGGFMAITDFDPGVNCKTSYIHASGVWSYKQDYSKFFTSDNSYYLVAKDSLSHASPYFTENNHERITTTILFKEFDHYSNV